MIPRDVMRGIGNRNITPKPLETNRCAHKGVGIAKSYQLPVAGCQSGGTALGAYDWQLVTGNW